MGKNKHKKNKLLRAQIAAHRHAIEHGHAFVAPVAPTIPPITPHHEHRVIQVPRQQHEDTGHNALRIIKRDIRHSLLFIVFVPVLFGIIYYIDTQSGILLTAAKQLFHLLIG